MPKIKIEFEKGGVFIARLLEKEAPKTCKTIKGKLPFSYRFHHSIVSGQALVCLPPDLTMERENQRVAGIPAGALSFLVKDEPVLVPDEIYIAYGIFISRGLFKEKAVLLREQKNVEESYGLTFQELTPVLAESFSFRKGKGILVSDVKEGSRAEKDGIQRGDILVEIGEQKIEDVAAMKSALAGMKGPAKVKIFRKGSFSILTLNPVN